MDKEPSRRALSLAKKIPLDTLGRLVDAIQSKSQPHPMLLPCSDTEQYEALAQLVEILASLTVDARQKLVEQAYVRAKLDHNREKL